MRTKCVIFRFLVCVILCITLLVLLKVSEMTQIQCRYRDQIIYIFRCVRGSHKMHSCNSNTGYKCKHTVHRLWGQNRWRIYEENTQPNKAQTAGSSIIFIPLICLFAVKLPVNFVLYICFETVLGCFAPSG